MKRSGNFSEKTWKRPPGDVKCSFNKPAANFRRSGIVLCSKCGIVKKLHVISTKQFSSRPSSEQVKLSFSILLNSFRQKSEMFWLKVRKRWKKQYDLFQKLILKTFPWTRRRQCWWTCRSFFAKKLTLFWSMWKKDLKIYSFQKLGFLGTFLWTLRNQFWRPSWNLFDKSPEILH